jgi:hypothetical protein
LATCPKCGTENPEGAEPCNKCGAQLAAPKAQEVAAPAVATPEPEGKTFERQMDDLGKKMAAVGQKVGEGAEKRGTEFERRWYSTLGLLAPIIGGLIATIVFLIFILVVGAIAIGSEHRSFWEQLRDFLESYFLLFVGLFFLSSFTNYLNHVHRKPARWFTPIMTAVGLAGWFWILAQVLYIGARTLTRPGLRDLGDFVSLFLPVIFVIVLGIGYLVVLFRYMVEKSVESRPV